MTSAFSLESFRATASSLSVQPPASESSTTAPEAASFGNRMCGAGIMPVSNFAASSAKDGRDAAPAISAARAARFKILLMGVIS